MNVLLFQIDPTPSGYDREQSVALFDRITDRLRRVAGVQSVARSGRTLLAGRNFFNTLYVEGGDGDGLNTQMMRVSPEFFDTMGVPLLAGRVFEPRDRLDAPRGLSESAATGVSRSACVARTPNTLTTRTITEVAMQMYNPPHPGEILKELCLGPLDLTVTDAAKALGISRKTLSSIVNGRAGISPEMAVRLSMAFDTTAESWLNQQVQYDLWHAERKRKKLRVQKLSAA